LRQLLRKAVRDVVGAQLRAGHREEIALAAALVAHRILERRDLVARDAMLPGDDAARAVEPRAQVMNRQRPEAAVAHLVLARPEYFHGAFYRSGKQHRVDDELLVAVAAPPEAAAEQRQVKLDLLGRDAERLRDGGDRHGLRLRAAPDLAALGRDRSDRVE